MCEVPEGKLMNAKYIKSMLLKKSSQKKYKW